MLKSRIESAQGRDVIPQWRTHDAIKQAVRMGGPTFNEITRRLNELRLLREQADYDLDSAELQWDRVHRAVRTARSLIRNQIKALPEAEFRRRHVPRN